MTTAFRSYMRAAAIACLVTGSTLQAAHAAGGIGDAYVTSDASNIVRAYAGGTGAFLGNHCSSVNGSGQMAIHFGTTNGRVLVGHGFGGVDEFDAATGAFIKTYNPTGGWQWAGIYAPTGGVYIGDMNTNDVREYDATTGAFIRVVCNVQTPADMRFGPNGHLYICSWLGGFVQEVHPVSGAILWIWALPPNAQPNDIEFLPNGDMIVTAMFTNVAYVYTPTHVLMTSFSGTGWGRPHGVELNPADGKIYIVDGVTPQVHVFDPVTFAELNPAWRNPDPEEKPVDITFRPDSHSTSVTPATWSRMKSLFR